jgi:hypothetical protein
MPRLLALKPLQLIFPDRGAVFPQTLAPCGLVGAGRDWRLSRARIRISIYPPESQEKVHPKAKRNPKAKKNPEAKENIEDCAGDYTPS